MNLVALPLAILWSGSYIGVAQDDKNNPLDVYHGHHILLTDESTLKETIEAIVAEDAVHSEMPNAEVEAIRMRILAGGKESARILIEMLPTVDDINMADSIVAMLGGLEMDDFEQVRTVYKDILSQEIPLPPDEHFAMEKRIAMMVREFGDESDADLVFTLLEHENLSVQVLAVETLGSIGDLSTAKQIERILAERTVGMSESDKKGNDVFYFGTIALEQIRKREATRQLAVVKADASVGSVLEKSDTVVTDLETPSDQLEGSGQTIDESSLKQSPSSFSRWFYAVGAGILLIVGLLVYRLSKPSMKTKY